MGVADRTSPSKDGGGSATLPILIEPHPWPSPPKEGGVEGADVAGPGCHPSRGGAVKEIIYPDRADQPIPR